MLSFEDELRAQGVEVSGTFDIQKNCFDVLAMLWSNKCSNATFTITAIPKENKEKSTQETAATVEYSAK